MTMLTRMGVVAAVVAAITAEPALADQGGVPHNGGGQSNDHAAQPATPAQPGAPGDGATPATPAQPAQKHAEDDNGRGHSKHAAAKTRRSTPKWFMPAPQTSHAKAGKTTLCHATGSASNPYVQITISNNAVAAHRRHQDGRDIIPANGDCPGGTQSRQTPPAVDTQPVVPSSATLGTSFTAAVVSKEDRTATPRSRVLGARASGGTDAAEVAAEEADDATATLPAEATASADGDSSELPFTGMDLGILAAVGAALMLTGTALRRARRTTRVGS